VSDRDSFIRSLKFDVDLTCELVYRLNNLSDKGSTEELLCFLSYLCDYDKDIQDKYYCWIENEEFFPKEDEEDEEEELRKEREEEKKLEKEKMTLGYWEERSQELLEGLEEIRVKGPKIIDDYKKESEELKDVNSSLKERNKILSDIMNGNLSLDVEFFAVLSAGVITEVHLNNVCRDDKFNKNAIHKYTLRSLCEELMKKNIDVDRAISIYNLYKEKLSSSDTEEEIVKIRKRIYGNGK